MMVTVNFYLVGRTLYLLDRLAGGGVEIIDPQNRQSVNRREFYWVKTLFNFERIIHRAREGAILWYKSDSLAAPQEDFISYDPSRALQEEVQHRGTEGEYPRAKEREIRPEPDRVPIFPVVGEDVAQLYRSEEEARRPVGHDVPISITTWHDLMQEVLQSIPPTPNLYRGLRYRIVMEGELARAYEDLVPHFGEDSGNPRRDLTRTAIAISNGLRDLESEGEFFFEDFGLPIPEPVKFFRGVA